MSDQGSCGNLCAAACSLLVPGLGQLIQERHLAAIIQFVIAVVVWYYLLVELQLDFQLVWIGPFSGHLMSALNSYDFIPFSKDQETSPMPSQALDHQQATPVQRQAKPGPRRAKPVRQSPALPIDPDPTRFARTPPIENDQKHPLWDEWTDLEIALESDPHGGINEHGEYVRYLSDAEIAEHLGYYVDTDEEYSDGGGSGEGYGDSGDFC